MSETPSDTAQTPHTTEKVCFHCLTPIEGDSGIEGDINGHRESFCCHGCLGVAQWVSEAGLEQYYQVRTGAPTVENVHLSQYQPFDLPDIYRKYTQTNQGLTSIDLGVEGIHCAACMWLIEKSVRQQSGVTVAEGNATTFTLHIEWDDSQSKLSQLLAAIAKLGYQPLLNRDDSQQTRYDEMRRRALKRLALSGLGMMQVMMYSAALYAGAWQGMSPTMTAFFQWVSFFLTTPIFFYSGFPFLQSAMQAIKAKQLNMDVPVALAITLAYTFSVYHLLKGSGEIFFDSVVMFVFFLSAGRYLEMMGRYKALLRTAKNTAVLPEVVAIAEQADLAAPMARVPIDSLQCGDYLLVEAGEIIAADGTVLAGVSTVNESLLTGESEPVPKSPESQVLAGSINQEQTLLIRADAVGQQTTLAETKRLLSNAQTQKPRVQQITDRLAAYVVAFILLSTGLAFVVWQFIFAADNAFEIALSVLVATCPCALSLAVPTAYTAASNVLSNQRLFLKDNSVIDSIPLLTRLVFDKTGTLTTDSMQIADVELTEDREREAANKKEINEKETNKEKADNKKANVLAIAAALEQHIHHPIAKAFAPFKQPDKNVSEQHIISGKGVSGVVAGQHYTLGNADLIATVCEQTVATEGIYLCCDKTMIARFSLSNDMNPTAQPTIAALQQQGLPCLIASGDSQQRVLAVAEQLGIDDAYAEQLPTDKLNLVKQRQSDGETVMMVGDGINDAPVLAAAAVSLAVGGASALSRSQADIVLLNNDLRRIPLLLRIATRTHSVIRQNLIWAVCYNLLAVPFAVLGYLPPWMAALGMSISSLVVLANALRIYWVK